MYDEMEIYATGALWLEIRRSVSQILEGPEMRAGFRNMLACD